MNKLTIGFAAVLLFCSPVYTFSQSSTNSPYSYFGIGEMESSDLGRTAGMGGIGIGVAYGRMLNKANPASYSSLDSLAFLLDISLSLKSSDYSNSKGSFSTLNGGLKKFALGFRVSPFWAMSVGVKPFSSVGYNVVQTKLIEGSTSPYTVTFTGDGGLTQLYFGNSFKLTKHLAVGVNASYIMGSITKQEVYTSNSFSGEFTLERKLSPHAAYFDFGTQYNNRLNEQWSYIVGAVGSYKKRIGFSEVSTAELSTQTAEDNTSSSHCSQYIPYFMGIGASVKSSEWMFGADYRIDYWGSIMGENGQHIYKNASKLALGMEYAPNVVSAKSIFKRMVYQVGVKYDESYLDINSTNLDGYAITAGVGIPGRRTRTSFGLAAEYGKKGSLENGLIRENYFQLTLNINMSDIWFIRPKYE